MVLGTAACFLLACMNCNIAIWAVASCMATRSGRNANIALPRSHVWVSKLSACETSTFSDRVRPRPNFFLALANTSGIFAYRFLARIIDMIVLLKVQSAVSYQLADGCHLIASHSNGGTSRLF